jgi:hypothetical protein
VCVSRLAGRERQHVTLSAAWRGYTFYLHGRDGALFASSCHVRHRANGMAENQRLKRQKGQDEPVFH